MQLRAFLLVYFQCTVHGTENETTVMSLFRVSVSSMTVASCSATVSPTDIPHLECRKFTASLNTEVLFDV